MNHIKRREAINMTSLNTQTALITGASSGLGADFARDLTKRGIGHVVIVARRTAELETLAIELKQLNPNLKTTVITMDLSTPAAGAELFQQTEESGITVDILINNAGFGLYGDFAELAWEKERNMLELDILTLVDLSKRFSKAMRQRKLGYILQVSSIGAYQPCPTYASYGAAKAFVLSYGDAINAELKGSGVSCTTLSPGVTATEFLKVSGQQANFYQKLVMMQSPEVVKIGLDAMFKRKSSVLPGLVNQLSVFSNRFLNRDMVTAISHYLMKLK
jgi:uncharacterized protein